jgi:hypothetical protein
VYLLIAIDDILLVAAPCQRKVGHAIVQVRRLEIDDPRKPPVLE